jgi:hypothetical protein
MRRFEVEVVINDPSYIRDGDEFDPNTVITKEDIISDFSEIAKRVREEIQEALIEYGFEPALEDITITELPEQFEKLEP